MVANWITKYKTGGVLKYQAGKILKGVTKAAETVKNATKRAEERLAKEKEAATYPTFSTSYDVTRGWRESTEDAAKLDKYIAEELGASPEEAQSVYNDTWSNSRKSLGVATAATLGTAGIFGATGGAFGPLVADATNTLFAVDAARNLASGEGIQKTWRLARQGDWKGALKSGAWDTLDLSMLGHTAGLVGRVGKSVLNGRSLGNAYRSDVAGRLLEKEIKTVPLTSKSKLLFSKGNPTGSEIFAERYDGRPLNWSNINYDIESGKNDAIRYLASPRKMRTDLHNKAIAKRLFNVDIHPQTDPAIRASVPMELKSAPLLKGTWHPKYGVRLTFDPKSTTKGNTVFDFKDPKFDEVSLDLSSDLNDSALHEWLHRGNVGGGDNITRAFYKWKVQKLLKPGYTGYLETPEETGVNFIELGRRNGITNEPYPGFNEAKEKIMQIINTDPNKGYLLNDTVWETKPKRVWDALQGKYIGWVPISIAATSMINDNENE